MHWTSVKDTLLTKFLLGTKLSIITDMDGTISPIVDKPEEAYVTEDNRKNLAKLSTIIKLVAAVSGRSVSDLRERVGLESIVYAGSHGLERIINEQVITNKIAQSYRPNLENLLNELPQEFRSNTKFYIEDKTISISIHYRLTDDPAKIHEAYINEMHKLASKYNLKFMDGRKVFEFRPPVKIDKGEILETLITEYDIDSVIYIGDDVTDADAMKKCHQLREAGQCFSIGMGVLSTETPDAIKQHADFFANDVDDVSNFLAWLIEKLD